MRLTFGSVHKALNTHIAFVFNMCLLYIVNMLCRLAFVLENKDALWEGLSALPLLNVLAGCLAFDTSAILYLNAPYALLMLFPIHLKETRLWQTVAKTVFLLCNGIGIAANLADCVYFKYTGRRTTATVFSEFANEDNLTDVFMTEMVSHWYIILFGVLLIGSLWFAYSMPTPKQEFNGRNSYLKYYTLHLILLLAYIPLTVIGMRGGATTAVRPITISNANQYVNHPTEAAAVLNTPFSIIRTLGKKVFIVPEYFSQEELDAIYTPVHYPKSENADSLLRKNVVILIVESFGREYIGAYNERLEGGCYKGYTPFVDSLYAHSMSFDYTFCNGRKSIDGMPSILSSIPMFVEPFFLTPSSMNDVSGIAGELGKVGYSSAFFHGAQNGSMGFQAFARTTGFQEYYGRTEYNADKRFNGDKDFDGMWAIWDEPFLQFYALKMSEMKEPFVTSVFTASSHHPYAIPEEYKDIYPEEGGNVIHKCIRYTDHALQQFFETASKQPWFKNTIFVLTSDHTNISDHAEYQTDLGIFGSPILFYDPSGQVFPAGRIHKVAQQIDIMPTILETLGYNKPFVAFGKNLLSTPDNETWAINYNSGIYQYVKNGRLLQFDGEKVVGMYDLENDWLLQHNLTDDPVRTDMERSAKAIIQSYMSRMISNTLIAK